MLKAKGGSKVEPVMPKAPKAPKAPKKK